MEVVMRMTVEDKRVLGAGIGELAGVAVACLVGPAGWVRLGFGVMLAGTGAIAGHATGPTIIDTAKGVLTCCHDAPDVLPSAKGALTAVEKGVPRMTQAVEQVGPMATPAI